MCVEVFSADFSGEFLQMDHPQTDLSQYMRKPPRVYHLLHFIVSASSALIRELRMSSPALEAALQDIEELVQYWGLEDFKDLQYHRDMLLENIKEWAAASLSAADFVQLLENDAAPQQELQSHKNRKRKVAF